MYPIGEAVPSAPLSNDVSQGSAPRPLRSTWLTLLLGGLVAFRLVYHAAYLDGSPFALGTFSDGRIYELAARDILGHPPLGTEPFYLQGTYAYFMALCMWARADVSMVLLGQLTLSAFTIWVFHRVTVRIFGLTAGTLSTVVLLACPALMFYENKFLSAQLGVAGNVAVLWAFSHYRSRSTPRRAGVLGIAAAVAVLARPNMLLLLPFLAAAIWRGRGADGPWRRHIGALVLGFLVGVTPMTLRNIEVTGDATFMPTHGGGTSFYIGNNPRANGLWNTAGGLLTPEVVREREELAHGLGVADRAGTVGSELYGRAFAYMRERPGDWVRLQFKKIWLTFGNDELTQDYDWQGEAETLGWARWIQLPFGLLLGIGALGLARLCRLTEHRVWWWVIGGQLTAVLAANILFFTSSQHRLALVVPLAFVSGVGLLHLREVRLRLRLRGQRELLLAMALTVQAFVPRSKKTGPSAVHYFNQAVVQGEIGLHEPALESVVRAVALRPDHPLIRLEHARLLWRTGHWDASEIELEWLESLPNPPPRVSDQVWRIREAIREDRADAAAQSRANSG